MSLDKMNLEGNQDPKMKAPRLLFHVTKIKNKLENIAADSKNFKMLT